MFDIVKAQAMSLRDIERGMPAKVSKTEFSDSIKNLKNEIEEGATDLESRINRQIPELQSEIRDRLTKSEIEKLIPKALSVSQV